MDDELQLMSKEQLVKEIMKLRMAISEHRDSTGAGISETWVTSS